MLRGTKSIFITVDSRTLFKKKYYLKFETTNQAFASVQEVALPTKTLSYYPEDVQIS